MKSTTIILILLLTCCSPQPALDQYLNSMGLSLMDNYTVINNESSATIGDMSDSYSFTVSDRDYENILNKIKSVEGFNDERRSHNNSGKYAYLRDGQYGYEVVSEDGFERYCLLINSDKTMILTYIQE